MTYWLFLNSQADLPQEKINFWLAIADRPGKLVKVEKGIGEPDSTYAKSLAQSKVNIVIPTSRVLLTEVKWPKNVTVEKRTLIYALEEKLISEPEDVEIEVLEQKGNILKVAVVGKSLLEGIRELAKKINLPNYQITVDVLLMPISEGEWSLWHSDNGLLFRFDKYLGVSLPEEAGDIGIKLKLAESIKNNSAPISLRICDFSRSSYLQELLQEWKIPIKINVDNTIPLEFLKNHQTIFLQPQKASLVGVISNINNFFAGFMKPVLVIASILILALVGSAIKMRNEKEQLKSGVDDNFYKVFPRSAVKTNLAHEQIENLYNRKVSKNNQNFDSAFAYVLQKVIAGVDNPPKTITWKNDELTVEFEKKTSVNNKPNINSKNFIVNNRGNKVTVVKNPSLSIN